MKHFSDGDDSLRRLRGTVIWNELAGVNNWSFTPRITRCDPASRLVEFEFIESDGDLQSDLEIFSAASFDRFEVAGSILREVHTARPVEAVDLTGPALNRTTADLVVAGMHALPLETFAGSSGGELELWRMLQPDRKLSQSLHAWNASLRRGTVSIVHGDLRPDQFLKDTTGGLHLIDGEEVTVGSPLTDLGGMLGAMMFSFLMRSVSDARETAEVGPLEAHGSFTEAADRRLFEFVPFAQALLRGYGGIDHLSQGRELLGQGIGWAILERVLARAMFSYRLATTDRVLSGIGRQAILEPSALNFIYER